MNYTHTRLVLYYITDRSQFSGDEASRRKSLLGKIADAASSGIDFIQLREKDLPGRELVLLAREAMRLIRQSAPPTRLLINSRTDVAIAVGADGVHLRSLDISPADVRQIWKQNSARTNALVSVGCHGLDEVGLAKENGADFALFGPVFAKRKAEVPRSATDAIPAGLNPLKEACLQKISVIALGGVTLENARCCVDAGASGVAAIRLFQETPIDEVVRRLRS